MGDGAYCASDNYEAAIAKCIGSYFEPKKNYAGKGTGNWAKMVRLWREHPGRFCQAYKTRTTIEAAFSAIQGHVYILRPVRDRGTCKSVGSPSSQYVATLGPDGP